MIRLHQALGRMPKRYEVAKEMGVDPTRISRLWSRLEIMGYMSLNPLKILKNESGQRVSIDTAVTIRVVGA